MLKKLKKNASLSDKISEVLANPNRTSSEEDDDSNYSEPRVADFDEEYYIPDGQTTNIRKQNVKLLSEQSIRYRGKIVSRKDLENSENEESSDDNEGFSMHQNENDEIEEDYSDSEDDKDKTNQSDSAEGSIESTEFNERESEDDANTTEEDDDKEMNIIETTNSNAEIQRGHCVQNQLTIWEKLLELRIQLQKILTKSNVLQLPEENNEQMKRTRTETTTSLCSLLEKLMELKFQLKNQYSELKKAVKVSQKRRHLYDDVDGESPPLKRIADCLDEYFTEFRNYRNEVLLKWDDRTKILRSGSKLKSAQEEYDIISKIQNILANRNALIEKSQLIKSNNDENAENVRNKNAYDDSDFYHNQLRELIEYKTNTSASMLEVTKQYAELQKVRQKMKKKVDTRASKGRKLRYVVHNKLVNFKAPENTTSWADEAQNELFKSLFAAQ